MNTKDYVKSFPSGMIGQKIQNLQAILDAFNASKKFESTEIVVKLLHSAYREAAALHEGLATLACHEDWEDKSKRFGYIWLVEDQRTPCEFELALNGRAFLCRDGSRYVVGIEIVQPVSVDELGKYLDQVKLNEDAEARYNMKTF